MSPLERLNEQVNDAATGEANCKGVVIGVAEGDNAAGLFARENRECFGDDSAFHATAADRTNDFTVFVDSHGSASTARAGALNVDNASKSNALAGCAPTVNVIKEVTHD
jgi:hypothetical protein